jgi:uncharacterized protein (TIGR03437 family)
LAAVIASASFLQGQPLQYTLLPAEGARPSARFDGTIAYDPAGRQLFLFGGSELGAKNDLWSYSLDRRQWTEIQVSGTRPPARFGHTLIYDPVRKRLIVFAGQAAGFFSDTWAYDIEQGSWQQLSRDEAGPSRRYGHSAIYDPPRDRMVISHGFTDAGRFDDTWAFEFATNTWRNLTPSGGKPIRRCLHHAVHDSANNQMLLYGGCASPQGPCPLGDLWSFDLSSHRWTEITVQPRPPAREHYGIVFDSARGRLVLFGGRGGGQLNDTWDYDPRGGFWRQAVLQGLPPAPRSRHESAYAADRGAAFFFGGLTQGGASNELWMLAAVGQNRPQVAAEGVVNAFSGSSGAVAPGEIVSIFGNGLGPVEGFALSLDPLTNRLPTSGPGVRVTWNGTPAPLYYLSANQLNVQVPYEIQGSAEANLVVTVAGLPSAPVTLPVVSTKPGLFPRIFHPDGSVNSTANAATQGSIIILFATGQGVTNPPVPSGAFPADGFPEPVDPVALRIGGREAEVLFRGLAPGTAGVIQVNARIPEGLAVPDTVPVVLSVGSRQSQAGVTIAIR